MSAPLSSKAKAKARRNIRLTAGLGALLFAAMFGMAYAAVPLYDLFCRVTGYGGTTQIAGAGAGRVLEREITVRFDANVADSLSWSFKPVERKVRLKIGQSYQAAYRAANTGAVRSAGTSTYNVTPQAAGVYFNKLECFCFTEQALEVGQSAELPVEFFIDPAIAEDKNLDFVDTITLSYTFFPVAQPAKPPEPQVQIKPLQNQDDALKKL